MEFHAWNGNKGVDFGY